MKRLIFGLLVAAVAFGGSAFTNVDKTKTNPNGSRFVDAGFLVQTEEGTYEYIASNQDNGVCEEESANQCKYSIDVPNTIPTQESYTLEEVTETYDDQLSPAAGGDAIYDLP